MCITFQMPLVLVLTWMKILKNEAKLGLILPTRVSFGLMWFTVAFSDISATCI